MCYSNYMIDKPAEIEVIINIFSTLKMQSDFSIFEDITTASMLKSSAFNFQFPS